MDRDETTATAHEGSAKRASSQKPICGLFELNAMLLRRRLISRRVGPRRRRRAKLFSFVTRRGVGEKAGADFPEILSSGMEQSACYYSS
jgi:hypothetical protein